MAITIKELAKHVGMSVSTVSKALNSYSDVSQSTKEKVLDAALKLGYQPQAAARNLRLKRSNKIGFLLPFKGVSSETFMEFFRYAAMAAENSGYSLLFYTIMTNESSQLMSICRSREVDGMILIGQIESFKSDKATQILTHEGIPFVLLGHKVKSDTLAYVAPDNYAGALAALKHLLAQGHKRIAYFGRFADEVNNNERFKAYKDALANEGLSLQENLVKNVPYAPYAGASVMRDMFETLTTSELPTAIFCFNDHIAMDAAQAIHQQGLKIPEDIALVGFDGIVSGQLMTPALSTVQQPLQDMGKTAMTMLIELMEAHSANEVLDMAMYQVVFPTTLVVRGSSTHER